MSDYSKKIEKQRDSKSAAEHFLGENESQGSSMLAPAFLPTSQAPIQRKSNSSAPAQMQDDPFGPSIGGYGFGGGGGFQAGIGLSFKLGGKKDSGWKVNVYAQHMQPLGGNFNAGLGAGLSYYSNFHGTEKSGWEFRGSGALNYNDGDWNATLGTNYWNGFGGLDEFDQRTGFSSLSFKGFGMSYENDGAPFPKIGLGDGGDQYRTAAASLHLGEFDLDLNLFTGKRDKTSYEMESQLPGGEKGIPEGEGKYGETYDHGFVVERGPKYRMGNLTLNYNGVAAGVNSEWVRHSFQNVFAHHIISPQRQFPMLSGDWSPVLEYYTKPRSPFTLWDR